MAGKIIIDTERCKGCGLCVAVCPKNCIVISKHSNKNGYFPAQVNPIRSKTPTSNEVCTGCAMCALICPEAIIEVFRDEDVVVIKPDKKAPNTIKSVGGLTG